MLNQRLHNRFNYVRSVRKVLLVLAIVVTAGLADSPARAQAANVASSDIANTAAPPASTAAETGPGALTSVARVAAPVAALENPGSRTAPPRLIVRDGQFCNQPFEVFIDQQLSEDARAELVFWDVHHNGGDSKVRSNLVHIEPNQMRQVLRQDKPIWVLGTALVFELECNVRFFYAAIRVKPVVHYSNEKAALASSTLEVNGLGGGVTSSDHVTVVHERDVYLGNFLGAFLWTVVTLLTLAAILAKCTNSLSKRIQSFQVRPALLLLTGPSGFLSLSQTQVVVWTVVIGGLVFMFGLLRLAVPEIPHPLIALMGMSLLTGLVGKASGLSVSTSGAIGSSEPPPAALLARGGFAPGVGCDVASGPSMDTATKRRETPRARCADLVSTWNEATGEPVLSLPKAQMVFWTAIVVILFIVKTVLSGKLWEVPWELVTLTGFSQCGYIGDKFVGLRPQITQTPSR